MASANICHALGLHMHQPPGNLEFLIDNDEFQAEQIIRCYERTARYAHLHADVSRFHVSFSGVLLEQLRDPQIVNRYRKFVDIPRVLDMYRSTATIELVGSGYFHPIFPLIPIEDWQDQLVRSREIMEDIFGRAPLGFWPPGMAFCMEMVPALAKAGYEYVVIDGDYVQPKDDMHNIFQPYKSSYDDATITVIPRDRIISYGQESGMNEKWFAQEVDRRVPQSPHSEDLLVTSWSPGEGGGWFLQMHEESGFFGNFFAPYIQGVREGKIQIRPVLLGEYIRRQEHLPEAQVLTGKWEFVSQTPFDLGHWIGSSEAQRVAVTAIRKASARYSMLARRGGTMPDHLRSELKKARDLILESEASCFLVRGDSWVSRVYDRTRPAEELMAKVEGAVDRQGA